MLDLLPALLPLLIVDVLNPVLFALLIFAIGSSRPVANSSAFLAGHTAAYFVAGIAFAIGLQKITARLENPEPVDFAIELIIGCLLLWAALASRGGNASQERSPEGELTPLRCFGFGAIVNFIGVPFALPYMAAIDQILKAELSIESSLLVLAIYNVAYALPFALVPMLVVIMGDASRSMLEKFNDVLVSVADRVMPLLLLLVGLALIADATMFFVYGETLW